MRSRGYQILGVGLVPLALGACDQMTSQDAATTGSVAPSTPPPAATVAAPTASAEPAPKPPLPLSAVNAAAIEREAEESALDAPPKQTPAAATKVFTSASGADLVGVLSANSVVFPVAEYQTRTLVRFFHPTRSWEELAGWIDQSELGEFSPPAAPPCGPGLVQLTVGTELQCLLPCRTDSDCSAPDSCTGTGKDSSDKSVKFCMTPVAPAAASASAAPSAESPPPADAPPTTPKPPSTPKPPATAKAPVAPKPPTPPTAPPAADEAKKKKKKKKKKAD